MGLTSIVLRQVMEELGITEEMVDKIKSVIDNVDIHKYDDQTIIEIKMKKISIVIDKQHCRFAEGKKCT